VLIIEAETVGDPLIHTTSTRTPTPTRTPTRTPASIGTRKATSIGMRKPTTTTTTTAGRRGGLAWLASVWPEGWCRARPRS
jgi:hypothetical protein